MNTSYDFNAESTETANNRRKLAAMLQQMDILPNEQFKMPGSPGGASSVLTSPMAMEMMQAWGKQNAAGKSAQPPAAGGYPVGGGQ